MAKRSAHFVKKQQKSFFTKKDIKWLKIIGVTAILSIIAFFVTRWICDDSLSVKNGVVAAEDNWLVTYTGDANDLKYYKYGEYDFAGYDGIAEPGNIAYDDNTSCVTLYPADNRYQSAMIYALSISAEELAIRVSGQLISVIGGDADDPYDELEGGYAFWYPDEVKKTLDDGTTVTVYQQYFTCYMPAEHDGTIVIRIIYEFESEDEYVTEEAGYNELKNILGFLNY